MDLELAITSYQRLSPTVSSTRRFGPGQIWVLGRAESCDWHLPDPGKVVSSRHAEIRSSADGHFLIRDTSTNGVFINDSAEPLGRDTEATLGHGDRLRFGDYELTVSLAGGGSAAPEPATDNRWSGEEPEAEIALADSPAPQMPEANDLNSTLASGLNERFLGDSHVELPQAGIPDQWDWGAVSGPDGGAAQPDHGNARDLQLSGLLEGLGLRNMAPSDLTADQCRALGVLTRTLLDRLLDLLQMRARQKQQLRVKQTLFQRSENNPLKFSATSSDALESLLFRRHPSFLGPEEAVSQAFGDVVSHERALLSGVEGVIRDLLHSPPTAGGGRVFGSRKALAAVQEQRQQHQQEYGDIDRMLRSDTFVDAYEAAVSRSERE